MKGERGRSEEFFQRLLFTIADAEGATPRELPPLGNSIDMDALQAFLESSSGTAKAEFEYLGRRVHVPAKGRITVSERHGDSGPYVARCSTCGEEKRGVNLETAQGFFAEHADQSHAVEVFRNGDATPDLPERLPDSESEKPEGS